MEDQQRTLADLYIGNNDYYSGGGGAVPLGVVLPPIQPLRKMDLGAPIHVHPQYYSVMHTHSAFTPPHMLHMQPHLYATVSRERTSNARGHDELEDPIADGNAEMQHYLHTSFHPYGLSPQDAMGPNGAMMLTEEQAMEVDAARALEELAGAGRIQQQHQQRGGNNHTQVVEPAPIDVISAHYAGGASNQSSPTVIAPPFSPPPTTNGASDPNNGESESADEEGGEEVESRTTGGLDNPFPASCSRPSPSTSYYRTAEERAAATPRPQRPRKSRTGVPVPVPHLTKPSRGRRVPTAEAAPTTNTLGSASPVSPRSGTTSPYGTRNAASNKSPQPQPVSAADVEAKIASSSRAYVCQVEGCGKAFRRGEHLKRHVRSLHTHDKPERCTHPGCGKEFSRKDNMQQHLKIHAHNRISSNGKDGETSEEPEAVGDDDDETTPPEDESHSS
ncbi:hypothetical protein FRB94_004718 [Tulasnella sp. JGI-2019a]|nr:hypothetical protein FRB93_011373 [Tulasnella sp. JGI-2019a]KAG9012908.1 hypothetical protein FRB94_004718 [Tulasnella sp. JGI-2019a]KAG9036663.1 hypothetical protein FRB95_008247 [Tulasnella sp. JGI-2019a]